MDRVHRISPRSNEGNEDYFWGLISPRSNEGNEDLEGRELGTPGQSLFHEIPKTLRYLRCFAVRLVVTRPATAAHRPAAPASGACAGDRGQTPAAGSPARAPAAAGPP